MLSSPLAALALLLAVSPAPAAAAPGDSGTHWSATGELSFSDVSGNRSLSLLTTGFGLKRASPGSVLGTVAGARYGRSNGTTAVENYTAELNARFLPQRWVSPFFYTRGERDLIKNLDLRVSAAAGVDLNVVAEESERVSIGMAVLEDWERRLLPEGSTDPRSVSLTRFNLRVVATPTIRKGVTAEHRSQFEPVADNLGDYLFSSTTSVRVLLTGGLAFQTSYQYTYDSTPAPGVTSRSDRALTTGLIVEVK
jgi:hypothetical protein